MGHVCTSVLTSSNRWPFLLLKRSDLTAWVIEDQEAVGGGRLLIIAIIRVFAAGGSTLLLSFVLLLHFSVLAIGIVVALGVISIDNMFIAYVAVTVCRNMCLSNIITRGTSFYFVQFLRT